MRLANSVAKGICAGKHSVADYLVEQLGFSKLYLARTSPTPLVEKSASQARVPVLDRAPRETDIDDETFPTVQDLVDFVTKRWQQRWVITDVWDEDVLELLSRRPFFSLVSVDAPVSIRWRRFKER